MFRFVTDEDRSDHRTQGHRRRRKAQPSLERMEGRQVLSPGTTNVLGVVPMVSPPADVHSAATIVPTTTQTVDLKPIYGSQLAKFIKSFINSRHLKSAQCDTLTATVVTDPT